MSFTQYGTKSGADLVVVRRVASQRTFITPLFKAAWDELPELQCRSYEQYAKDEEANLVSVDRVEILAHVGGKLVGTMALGLQHDTNVGPVVAPLHTFILPGHRNCGVLGEFLRCLRAMAKEHGVMYVLCRRLGPFRYQHTFRSP